MTTYLVGNIGDGSSGIEAQDFLFVVADTKEQAIQKFVRYYEIGDGKFQEYVYDKSVNLSFAETFYLESTEETDHFQGSGEVIVGEDVFRKRVREFFQDYSEYADLYLNYYFGNAASSNVISFPEDMLLYIWFNSSWATIGAIDITDIPTI